jgi:hypothetical protein
MARKPLTSTVAANVLEHGTGALNVDGCRVEGQWSTWKKKDGTVSEQNQDSHAIYGQGMGDVRNPEHPSGRWPANLIHDGSYEVVGLFPQTAPSTCGVRDPNGTMGYHGGASGLPGVVSGYADTGSAARFFKQCNHTEADLIEGDNATVKPWNQPEHLPARDTDAPMREAEKAGPASGSSTISSGSLPMDQSQTGCKSITSTETKKTTDSKTSSSSPQQSTSASIPSTSEVDSTATGNANAPVVSNGSLQLQSTSTSAKKAGCSMDAADHATLPESLPINEPGVKRLYYTAKATRAERQGTSHPTTKPIALMAYLCRLVTPPGGTVLDPFMGSGTTIKAANSEGFYAIGIEQDPDSFAMAKHRTDGAQLGLSL